MTKVWVSEGCAAAAQERYEKHHHCMYDADAVNGAVVLSARYIADRQLPDKAIDLMDEAGSRVRIAAHTARRAALASGRLLADRSAPWLELQQVLEAKEEAIKVRAQFIIGHTSYSLQLQMCWNGHQTSTLMSHVSMWTC